MSVAFGSYDEAVELAEIFYPKAGRRGQATWARAGFPSRYWASIRHANLAFKVLAG